ncbi:hypothetical protein CLV62_1089 [Dysgonomonas alginatilytica]|uniref:Uncharacterized protein n=1 Tax=Dysgonomonas alginatilytica TaxID=1605892 RepID=A0A2V3PR60_9BACT|nr:hypothetical protein [Dysgonomonas alginatilytica]PXV65011.1 hypothetical protein CLV62_1089 [Dysgonomonas alginatilytica]
MKKIYYCLIICFFSLPVFSENSNLYKTHKLEEMANLFLIKLPTDKSEGYHSVSFWEGYPVVIHVDQKKVIDHIGVYLFNRDQIVNRNMNIVFDFVERYLLELIQVKDRTRIAAMTRDDKVVIEYGDFPDLKKITPSHILEISQSELKNYRISWTEKASNKTVFAMSFPLQYELMLGMNKIEIEDNLLNDINYQQYDTKELHPLKKEKLLPVPQTDYYIRQGAKYILESMNSNLYYKKEANRGFSLLSDTNYPVELVANLMISDEIENNFLLNITQYKYGQNTTNFTIPLKQWVSYCLHSGCTPYFGVESQDESQIKASVIMENKKLGYNHILYIVFDKSQLSKLGGTIDAKLYSYIPTHNVTDLFYETQNKRVKQKK